MAMARRMRAKAHATVFALVIFASTGGVTLIATAPAQAASLGALTLTGIDGKPQTSGTVDATPMFASATTSAPCPAGFGENASLRIGPPGGPYSNLAKTLGGGGYDEAPVTSDSNRSFTTALGNPPADGVWHIIMECYSLTEGRHPDEFQLPIMVCGRLWKVGDECPTAVPTGTRLSVEPSWSVEVGTPVTLTVTVSPPGASGQVIFQRRTPGSQPEVVDLGSKQLGAEGKATMEVSDLPLTEADARHELTAHFVPASADDYLPSDSDPALLNVRAAGTKIPTEAAFAFKKSEPFPTGTPIALTVNVMPPGVQGVLQIQVKETSAGTVYQTIGEIQATGSSESFDATVDPPPAGTYDFQGQFVPTSQEYAPDQTPSITTISISGPDGPQQAQTTLSVSPVSPQPVGTSVTLTATISPANAAGIVTFLDGTTSLYEHAPANGTLSYNVTSLGTGTHTLTAKFAPKDTQAFAASTSAAVTYVINPNSGDGNGDDGDNGDGNGDGGGDGNGDGGGTDGGTDGDNGGGVLALTGSPIISLAMGGATILIAGVVVAYATRPRRLHTPVQWPDGDDAPLL